MTEEGDTMNHIDAILLSEAFRDCLYRQEEVTQKGVPPTGSVLVESIRGKFGFHPKRLESHREEVIGWLRLLPHPFRKSDEGGWSFLQACVQEDGRQWGEHQDMEQLFALAIGLGLAEWQLPREMWPALTGGANHFNLTT